MLAYFHQWLVSGVCPFVHGSFDLVHEYSIASALDGPHCIVFPLFFLHCSLFLTYLLFPLLSLSAVAQLPSNESKPPPTNQRTPRWPCSTVKLVLSPCWTIRMLCSVLAAAKTRYDRASTSTLYCSISTLCSLYICIESDSHNNMGILSFFVAHHSLPFALLSSAFPHAFRGLFVVTLMFHACLPAMFVIHSVRVQLCLSPFSVAVRSVSVLRVFHSLCLGFLLWTVLHSIYEAHAHTQIACFLMFFSLLSRVF